MQRKTTFDSLMYVVYIITTIVIMISIATKGVTFAPPAHGNNVNAPEQFYRVGVLDLTATYILCKYI